MSEKEKERLEDICDKVAKLPPSGREILVAFGEGLALGAQISKSAPPCETADPEPQE